MPTVRRARALGQSQQPQQSPTEWVSALAEGAGRYVSATTDPLRQLADAEAALQSALARGSSPERIRELRARVDVARIRAREYAEGTQSSREWAALGKVLTVSLVGFVVVSTAAVAYRAVRD
jgi:hypothetical protein